MGPLQCPAVFDKRGYRHKTAPDSQDLKRSIELALAGRLDVVKDLKELI